MKKYIQVVVAVELVTVQKRICQCVNIVEKETEIQYN